MYDAGVIVTLLICAIMAYFGTVFTAGLFIGYLAIYLVIAVVINLIWKKWK